MGFYPTVESIKKIVGALRPHSPGVLSLEVKKVPKERRPS
jgi:hypothetical protein